MAARVCGQFPIRGKSCTIQESNQASGVLKAFRIVLLQKSSILLARTGVRKNSTVASGSSPIKTHNFDYHLSFINRRNEVDDFSIKYRYRDIFLKKKH